MRHSVLSSSIVDHPALSLILSVNGDFNGDLTLTLSSLKEVIKKSIERSGSFISPDKIAAPCDSIHGYVDAAKLELILTNVLHFFSKQNYTGRIDFSVSNKIIDGVQYISIRISDSEGRYFSLAENWNTPFEQKSLNLGNYLNLIVASTLVDYHVGVFEYVRDSGGFAFVVNLPQDIKYYKEQSHYHELEKQVVNDSDALKLVDKAIEIICQNISDFQFNIRRLCRELGVSQTNLYRKLQEAIGISPNQLIRQVRLQEAYKILKSKNYLVAEVAIMVGFRDTRYFSKIFKKAYGVYPASYAKSSSIRMTTMYTY